MKLSKLTPILIILCLSVATPSYLTSNVAGHPDHSSLATPTPLATLEVWNPDLRSSNITSLTQFPAGSTLAVRVNVTNAGPLVAFDVSLNYELTTDLNVLQAVPTGTEFSGGLFDPNHPPSGCTVYVLKNDYYAFGSLRFAAVIVGGCSVAGSGTLFTIMFQVLDVGAGFINIVRTDSLGKPASIIVGGSGTSNIPYKPVDARFQNKRGIPPVASFTFDPAFPVKGDIVNFNATTSRDPDNQTGPGISRYIWVMGDGAGLQGANLRHVFLVPVLIPAYGNFTVTLIVWDTDDGLPGTVTQIVSISLGIREAPSSNWSGYAISSTPGSVTDVKGSWIVPAIIGPCGTVDQYASFWVGIDGLTSSTVEQTGTDSACVNGSPLYYAWYEFYPQPAHIIHQIAIHPGDIISAEVSYTNGKVNVTIVDVSLGARFSKLASAKGNQLSSAEWIAEAPSSKAGTLQLANFGTAQFGKDATGVEGGCSATLAGTTGTIANFVDRAQRITMLDRNLFVKAATSDLSADKTSFTVTWISPGP